MDHNPEVYYVSAESAKKWTLIIVSVQFFDFFFFKVIFRHFRPFGGSLGAPWYPWWPPSAPMRSLTSIVTRTPCLVLPPVQLGEFADFWGLPTTRKLPPIGNGMRGRIGPNKRPRCRRRLRLVVKERFFIF